MNPDPQLIAFVREHLKEYGAQPLKEQLLKDGWGAADIDAALAEAARPGGRPRAKWTIYTLAGGALLWTWTHLSSQHGSAGPNPTQLSSDGARHSDQVFRGHYGYILKLPPGYEADESFEDAPKTHEVVHIYPKGIDRTNLIDEGLYGQLGILRLDISPRRVPQGLIDLTTLNSWVKSRLQADKAQFTLRQQLVHGMPGFIVTIMEPFPSVKAYVLGQKVYYTLMGGSEQGPFTNVLSSLIEVAPTDEPGK